MPISRKVHDDLAKASWIRKMFDAANLLKQEMGADGVMDFSLGNPVLEPPAAFQQSMNRATLPGHGTHRYMSNAGYPETRETVAANLQSAYGISYTGANIVMTCGAAGGLNVVMKTLLDPGDEVLAVSPYFPEYSFYVDNHGGVIKFVPATDDFQPDPDRFAAAITPRTKAVIINSPNNPTGAVYTRRNLQALADVLRAGAARIGHPIYLIADDIYRRIVYDNVDVPSIPTLYENTIVVSSWSKDLSIPGERLGYIAISPLIADAAEMFDAAAMLTRTLGFVNAPALMQRSIVGCIEARVDLSSYQYNRDVMCDALNRAGFAVAKPAGAFYLFPKTPTPDDVACCAELRKKGIITVPGSGFGRPGHMRVAYSVTSQTCDRAAAVLAAGKSH